MRNSLRLRRDGSYILQLPFVARFSAQRIHSELDDPCKRVLIAR
jgi:hypothetical protein